MDPHFTSMVENVKPKIMHEINSISCHLLILIIERLFILGFLINMAYDVLFFGFLPSSGLCMESSPSRLLENM